MAEGSNDLDLTWLWHPSVMAILPSIGLLVAVPWDVATMYSQPRKLKPNHLGSIKLVSRPRARPCWTGVLTSHSGCMHHVLHNSTRIVNRDA